MQENEFNQIFSAAIKYWNPRGWDAKRSKYLEHLAGYEFRDVQAAVDRLIDSSTFFPAISEIKKAMGRSADGVGGRARSQETIDSQTFTDAMRLMEEKLGTPRVTRNEVDHRLHHVVDVAWNAVRHHDHPEQYAFGVLWRLLRLEFT